MKITAVIKPGAKNDAVEAGDGIYYVRTKAPAIEGKANVAAIARRAFTVIIITAQ